MPPRLPIVGSDDGTWGTILNEFLSVEHNADGTQKTLSVGKGGTGAVDAATARTNLGAAAATDLTAHINDTSAAHAASAVSFTPTGTVAATDVQAAIAEVASEAGSGTVRVFYFNGSAYVEDTDVIIFEGDEDPATTTGGRDHARDIWLLTDGNGNLAGLLPTGGTTGQILRKASSTDYDASWQAIPTEIGVAVSDETTAITTGTAKVTFRMPYAMNLTAVRANLNTASSSGTPTIDINENGTTILSTKLTIDANEKTSTTAATAAVISDSTLADDAEITIDIDVAGTGAKGLKVWLIGTRT